MFMMLISRENWRYVDTYFLSVASNIVLSFISYCYPFFIWITAASQTCTHSISLLLPFHNQNVIPFLGSNIPESPSIRGQKGSHRPLYLSIETDTESSSPKYGFEVNKIKCFSSALAGSNLSWMGSNPCHRRMTMYGDLSM